MHLTCVRFWLAEELRMYTCTQNDRPEAQGAPHCPSPLPASGEGGTETPPRVGPCCEEEDLPADTEETLGASLLHEEAHNEGKGTTTVEGGELSCCGYLSILTVTPHCHPSLSPLTVTTTSLSVPPLTRCSHPSP